MKRRHDFQEKTLIEDSFRSRISSKLKTVLDKLNLQLNSVSQDNYSEKHLEETALQNFVISAKLQISELLNKNKKIPLKNSSSNPNSSNVHSLQSEISSRFQHLLGKSFEEKKSFEKNAANKFAKDAFEEIQLRELSHLLQDFLSSAKKKISISLNNNECESQTVQDSRVKQEAEEKQAFGLDNKSRLGETKTMDAEDSDSSHSGILLLGEAERAPDYLDLCLEVEGSDVDDPQFQQAAHQYHPEQGQFYPGMQNDQFGDEQGGSDDEEVIVLGEKHPTYQEITLDDDDDEEISESVVEIPKKPVRIPKSLQDLLYDCPKCDKKFRVESLLKFHVRMHSVVESQGMVVPTSPPIVPTEDTQRYCRKEKENTKLSSKNSRQHKVTKHKRKKTKKPS